MNNIRSQKGAAALVASIVIAAGILTIVLSVLFVSLNMRASLFSFVDSIQSFYSAESGVGEALMQLRREPNNFTFNDFTVGGISTVTNFIEISGSCDLPPECQYVPGTGWWGEYFNHSVNHPDMEVDPYPGPTPTPTEHDWFDDIYKTHEQIDASLQFATSMWFPYEGTIWEDQEGFAHDYHFTQHWRAKVTAPADANYGYNLASDDDSWILLDGVVVVNNSGTHAAFTKVGDIFLSAGDSVVELYFAERHSVESGFSFHFDDPTLIITPWPDGCGEDPQCNSNIESSASTTRATREARYTCNQEIGNCAWSELMP